MTCSFSTGGSLDCGLFTTLFLVQFLGLRSEMLLNLQPYTIRNTDTVGSVSAFEIHSFEITGETRYPLSSQF